MTKTNSLEKAPYVKTYRYEGDDQIDNGWALQHYAENDWRRRDNRTEWRPNNPFEAALTLEGQQRGRSAAYFLWRDEDTNTRYPMFISSMVDCLQNFAVIEGSTDIASWIVVKRGQNYGIELYRDEN